ncbi:MAG: hypothetical protein HRU34_22150 [Richelia sp.]|nr:hypothetical protein [Richelia sp.]
MADHNSLQQPVRIYVSRSLSKGVPTISDIARHFDISGRTLQRRLLERGYSFQILVDESRR